MTASTTTKTVIGCLIIFFILEVDTLIKIHEFIHVILIMYLQMGSSEDNRPVQDWCLCCYSASKRWWP